MASSSKRQTTFAKMQREQRVKEKRALKLEKKRAAKEAKLAGESVVPEGAEDDLAEPTDETNPAHETQPAEQRPA